MPNEPTSLRPHELPAFFRERAAILRRDAGAEQPAIAYDRAAVLLEEALRQELRAPLPLAEAALESGYTKKHLRRLIAEGKLAKESDGTILRINLPKKPGSDLAHPTTSYAPSRTQLARAVAKGGK